MRRIRMGVAVTAALAVPASLVLVGFDGGQAFAKGPHGKVTCTNMSGSISSTMITLSGCSGTAVPGTGGSSQSISITLLANGGPVTWSNSQTTTFGKPALVSKPAKKCPGYVKGASSEPTLEQFSGAITADTTGMKVPGKYKGDICISTSGNFSAEKPLKMS